MKKISLSIDKLILLVSTFRFRFGVFAKLCSENDMHISAVSNE